jgi:hypothetical protein
MLTGRQCAANIELQETDLEQAKHVISAFLFVGIAEYFEASVCQFAWIYGGHPTIEHFRKSRQGNYHPLTMDEALSPEEISVFLESERFDLALYEFAVGLFKSRHEVTLCPLSL